ncbi:hypothetical protein [Streptomyces sp. NBC_00887]|uniref:hypothetical protein n=1 Tax=Streptomyces sp. NBC_00887 TaxID=2975859 RepID=UPI003864ACD6|nr:hypothetical protein OG844_00320 [Streptomyces sp. NBC_00887]WSY36350.1 hypothetical protein OG844_45280 [Streptomyces sp. NBC_00887]
MGTEVVEGLDRRARNLGISWQNLVRAFFFRAEEIVQAHDSALLVETHRQPDDEREPCVAQMSVDVPIALALGDARTCEPADWAVGFDRNHRDALRHLPADPTRIGGLATAYGATLRPYPHRLPRYEIEFRNRSRTADQPDTTGMGLVIERDTEGIGFILTEDSSRCGPGSLELLSTCLIGALEATLGITGSPAVRVLEESERLRGMVGRWPYLELRDGALATYSPSRPTPVTPNVRG